MTLEELRLGKSQRGAIVGMTGSGKSVLATYLLPPTGNLVVIDPKRLFEPATKMPVFQSISAIKLLKPKRFIYRPTIENLNNMDAYDFVYSYAYHMKNVHVYTDDVVGIMSKSRYPHMLQVCYQMGRAHNVSMLSAFQRPRWLPLFLMSEADKFYAFHLTLPADIQLVSEFVKGYNPDKLKQYQFFYRDIRKMHNQPSIISSITLPNRSNTNASR